MDVYGLVRDAIVRRRIVIATYKGHRREMCPHVIGVKHERAHALLYQFGGTSQSGLKADPRLNWRCLFIDDLTDVSVVDGEWRTGPNHTRPQSCVDQVDVEIAY
jgi:hypothetical protein